LDIANTIIGRLEPLDWEGWYEDWLKSARNFPDGVDLPREEVISKESLERLCG
jgi:hypothetical protein